MSQTIQRHSSELWLFVVSACLALGLLKAGMHGKDGWLLDEYACEQIRAVTLDVEIGP